MLDFTANQAALEKSLAKSKAYNAAHASETDKVEGNGQNKNNGSAPNGGAKSQSNHKDTGAPKLPSQQGLLFKNGKDYGLNPDVARPETNKVPKTASAQDDAKKNKKSQGLNPDDPSAVSQDKSKNILDAINGANPGAIGHVLEKALQSMIMLKMMDKLTSPAGILSMASGGMGGALQGLAGSVGLSPMLGALNGVMPALSTSNILNGTGTDTLHNGMMGMINNVAVGALAVSEIAAATSTASTITDAIGAIAEGTLDAIDAVAAFGGPAFGLKPGSLASKIALIGPNANINTVVNVNGVLVNASIITSPNPHATAKIPILSGLEHVEIASAAISDITGTLSDALGTDNPIGQALGSISDVTNGVSNLAGTFSNISSFTPSALGGIVNGGIAGVVDGGLNKILGFPMSGLLGNVTSLLPNIGGSIKSALSGLGASGANVADLTEGLTNATKALSLSKVAHTTASNIFGEARAEAIENAVNGLANVVANVGSAMTMVTAFGDRVHCSLPIASAITAAAAAAGQNIIGLGQRI